MTRGRTSDWPGNPSFCDQCGARLEQRQIHGAERGLCPACGHIAFRSPSVGVAVVLRDEADRILLIKRGPHSTQPHRWAVPAGFLDYGEDVRDGAARELFEETALVVEVGAPIFVQSNFHDPAKLTVGIWFEGTILDGEARAGDDAVDLGWFPLDDLPDLAFETDMALIAQLVQSASG